ncbi:RnfABCDGE type electron transport complex subunit G [Thermodesulfobacteriota bacterium]
MREIIKMIVVLAIICGGSGLSLSLFHEVTKEPRAYQLLKFVQEPSIKAVLEGLENYDNDPIKDRIALPGGKDEKGKDIVMNIFPAKQGDKIVALAYGSSATGYHGIIEVMVGIDTSGKLTGISIMTHTETPGLGAKIVQADFTDQFTGLELSDELNLSSAGGKVDGISGASLSSKGVMAAVRKALELFPKIKEEVS